MLDECLEFLEEKSKSDTFSYEVIVVSDGSSDGTVPLALKYSKKYSTNKVRVLELIENRGKGGAVRLVSHFNLFNFIILNNCISSLGNAKCPWSLFIVCRCRWCYKIFGL